MLHYSCDLCKRPIDARSESRHVVKIEVFRAVEDSRCDESDLGEVDHLEEIQDLLEQMDLEDLEAEALDDDSSRMLRFDLCDHCRQRFLKNPLGARGGKKLDFSNN